MRAKGRYIYGTHPVTEALRAEPQSVERLYVASTSRHGRLRDVVELAEKHRVAIVDLARHKLDELVGHGHHQGIVAAVARFEYSELEDLVALATKRHEPALVVALDQVQDPHNLGAIARSTYALGGHGLVMPQDRACEVTPTALKTAAGALSHLGVARVVNLRRAIEELKEQGLWAVGAAAEGDVTLWDLELTLPTVIVVGSEGYGLRRTVAQSCDRLVRIPMNGELGSLNASVAASLFLYEATRQRRLAPPTR